LAAVVREMSAGVDAQPVALKLTCAFSCYVAAAPQRIGPALASLFIFCEKWNNPVCFWVGLFAPPIWRCFGVKTAQNWYMWRRFAQFRCLTAPQMYIFTMLKSPKISDSARL